MPTLETLTPLPSRTEVDEHSVRCRPEWWRSRIADPFYPTLLDSLPTDATRPRWHRIARHDVVRLAADTSHAGRVRLLAAAFAWGTGSNGLLLGRNTRWLKGDLDVVGARLATAADTLAERGAGAAYTAMQRGGGAAVSYVGPAFFTKYLYFVGRVTSVPGPAPLVLDRRVTTALREHTDLAMSRQGWGVTEYEAYLACAHALAEQHGVDADAVELALFRAGGAQS